MTKQFGGKSCEFWDLQQIGDLLVYHAQDTPEA